MALTSVLYSKLILPYIQYFTLRLQACFRATSLEQLLKLKRGLSKGCCATGSVAQSQASASRIWSLEFGPWIFGTTELDLHRDLGVSSCDKHTRSLPGI